MKTPIIYIICCFCFNTLVAQSDIASLEYFFDQDPGIGLATNIDIDPDAEAINSSFSISTSGLSEGTHRLFIRAINVAGQSSILEHKTFRITPAMETNSSNIIEVEYFFNQDPGVGLANAIDLTDAATIDEALTISTSGLSVGTHRLFIRAKNSNNVWSLYEHKTFRVAPSIVNNSSPITEAEYFFNQDPGIGLANTIDLTDAATIDEALTISTSGLLVGTHRLFVRIKNTNNEWSLYEHKTFRVAPSIVSNNSPITEAEYFFNQDPGIGLANTIDLTDAATIDETLPISTTGLPEGTHQLFIRTKNTNNDWSLYEHKTFRVSAIQDINTAAITEAEYFIDIDPGLGNATSLSISGDSIDENVIIPTSVSMAQGDHYLHIRVRNEDGTWSLYDRQIFEIDGTLGIVDETLPKFKIYPNPTADFVNIKTENNNSLKSVTIIDIHGKVILQLHNPLNKIDLSSLQQGTYLLHIQTENNSFSKRIIKH